MPCFSLYINWSRWYELMVSTNITIHIHQQVAPEALIPTPSASSGKFRGSEMLCVFVKQKQDEWRERESKGCSVLVRDLCTVYISVVWKGPSFSVFISWSNMNKDHIQNFIKIAKCISEYIWSMNRCQSFYTFLQTIWSI